MSNAVLIVSPMNRFGYDDVLEERYEFPLNYRREAVKTVGDYIVYYEAKNQGSGRSGPKGSGTYFAMARVEGVEVAKHKPNSAYLHLADYQEFTTPVSVRDPQTDEFLAVRPGKGWSVRGISQGTFLRMCELGFGVVARLAPQAEAQANLRDYVAARRLERSASFRNRVIAAYGRTCAASRLSLENPVNGHLEVEVAHIKPVGDGHGGPDEVQNGVPLLRTLHWMFDKGFFSLTDECVPIYSCSLHIPKPLRELIQVGSIALPTKPWQRPHPQFVRYHRQMHGF